ncbi:pinensin family lanthipeptide [Roseivirga sp. BDSF3-8]|uniref:pinensin family lanthipeptide n=1 Tax=Roseivirga sp. BDSF3-8 TaxID=3241598 RepID=UPI0035320D51
MKNEKLSLDGIKVKSFQTSLNYQKSQTIRGGYNGDNSECRTLCRLGCESAAESGCTSCGDTGGGGGGTAYYECGTQERITCLVPCD